MLRYRCELRWKTKAKRGLEWRARAYKCSNNASACEIKCPPAAALFLFSFTFKAWFYTFPQRVCVWRSELCSLICSASPCRRTWMCRSRCDVRDTDSQHLLSFFFSFFPREKERRSVSIDWALRWLLSPPPFFSTRRVKDKVNAG